MRHWYHGIIFLTVVLLAAAYKLPFQVDSQTIGQVKVAQENIQKLNLNNNLNNKGVRNERAYSF